MRKHYTRVLKTIFHQELFQSRVDLEITQEEMAHRLAMGSRSYVELDHGKCGCSSLTLARFLIYLCEDPQDFLLELRHAFENKEAEAA
jgi:DNA-binding XRE family transcriptional regulator